MSTYVTLKHERTGELQTIKIGWSWTLFLFSQFWGIPLLLRRLFDWAGVQIVLSALICIFLDEAETDPDFELFPLIISLCAFGLAIYLGLKGNEITGKQLLRDGWAFAEPESAVTQRAKRAWSMPQI